MAAGPRPSERPPPPREQRELRSQHVPVPRPVAPEGPQPELAQRERSVPLRREVELPLAGGKIGPERPLNHLAPLRPGRRHDQRSPAVFHPERLRERETERARTPEGA